DRRQKSVIRRFGLATLLVFDLILFAPLLWTGGVFSSHDFVRAHHPWRTSARGVLESENRLLSDPAASGETTLVRYRKFPEGFFWNPWVSAGAIGPFHLAQGFLSPFVALPAFLLPEAGIETGILFLKFNFAFLAAYAFLRSRRFSDLASAAGAAAWAFSTGQGVWELWMQSSVSITYPLLLMAVDRAFEEPRSPRAVRFAAVALLLCLSGGFPHWILYGAVAAALYFLLRAAQHGAGPTARALLRIAGAAAIAIAILLPSILATARFLRASGYGELRRGMGGSFALPVRQLRLYAVPDYAGTPRRNDYTGVGWILGDNYIETASGVGVAAVALAAVGLAALRRRFEARFALTLGALVAVPLYAGGLLLSIVGGLPLLNISLFARSKILIVFALALLAACGVEALERLAAGSAARRFAIQLQPFLIAVPLAFLALDFYPECRPAEAVFEDTPGILRLREASRRGERFAAAGWTLIPNVSEAYAIDDVRGHFLLDSGYRRLISAADANAFGPYGTYLVFDPRRFDTAAPVLDLLGVTLLAAPPGASAPAGAQVESLDAAPFASPGGPPAPRPPPALLRVYSGSDMTLFQRPRALPRVFCVARSLPGGDSEIVRADRETLGTAVFVDPAVHARLAAGETARAAGKARITALAPESFRVEVEGDAPTLLVTSQKRFLPYWRTFLDGREVESFAADGIFLGVEVPAGRHSVEGRFLIPRAELLICLLGLVALAVVMWRAVRNRVVVSSHLSVLGSNRKLQTEN
ncbi:MAG: hypothetical protein ABI968_11340, partial [Acidobacteriota bacterium]